MTAPVPGETAMNAVPKPSPAQNRANAAAPDAAPTRAPATPAAASASSNTAASHQATLNAAAPASGARTGATAAVSSPATHATVAVALKNAAPAPTVVASYAATAATSNSAAGDPAALAAAALAAAAPVPATAIATAPAPRSPDAPAGVAYATADFDFHRPSHLADALRFLAKRPEAVPIAGGTDLMVAVNYRLTRPAAMLDLTGLDELREWTDAGDSIRIGSGVPYSRIVAELATVLPGLAAAARTVGSPQIRNRGTLGGNLATASPAGDGHPPLLATGATVEIASAVPPGDTAVGPRSVAPPIDGPTDPWAEPIDSRANPQAVPLDRPVDSRVSPSDRAAGPAGAAIDGTRGTASHIGGSLGAPGLHLRTVPIGEFFLGPKRSALRPGELITAVTVPKAAGPQQFLKVGTRNAMVIAVCSFAVALDLQSRRLGTGIGSAGPTPLTAPEANRIELPWSRPALFNDALAEEFGRRVAAAARPIDDVRGTADYRRHALAVCAARALRRVWTAAHRERTT